MMKVDDRGYLRRPDGDRLNQERNVGLRKSQTGFNPWPGAAERNNADAAFRAAYDAAPAVPIFKHEDPEIRASDREVADNAPEQNQRVTNLIKAAHANRGVWDPFSATQDVAISKLRDTVGVGETGEIFEEGGQKLIRISKAA